MMNKYERLLNELNTVGTGKMKVFGQSMMPIIRSGSLLTFKKQSDYSIGDICFCKVKSRIIDAHKITAKDLTKGFLISNNKGLDNGWTHTVYGKVISAELLGDLKTFK
jgi:hypothetical protein